MTFLRRRWSLICSLLIAALAGATIWLTCGVREPVYSGKRLSVWTDELRILGRVAEFANTNHPQVQALRAVGTNAIPWLVSELRKPLPLGWQLNHLLDKQRVIKYRISVRTDVYIHQQRARSGFWALGEMAAPAIPSLVSMVERQPGFALSALAGIGAPALPALERCLTNISARGPTNGPESIGALVIGDLYVAIDAGRVSRSRVSYLLPTVRAWSQQATNTTAAYWANGVLEKLNLEP